MAKKKKNIKPVKGTVGKKNTVPQKKTGEKKTPSKKESDKDKKDKKNKSKPVSSTKKKTSSKKDTKKKKKKIGGGGKGKDTKIKKGAGFSSNNFNYIRSLIWREYGLDYVSYFDPKFIAIVRATYNECKAAGQECTDREILIFYDDILQNPNRDYPYIDEDLYTSPFPYFQLLDVKFDVFPAYLWIFSPMIMPPPSEFIITSYVNNKEGSADKGYRKYFKEFVDWANEAMRNTYGSEVDSEDVDIFIKFSKPEFIESKQRWETEIIICDADGNPESFGFEPKGRMSGHDVESEFEKPIEKPIGEEIVTTTPTEEKAPEKEITPEEAKKLKQTNEKLFGLLLNMKKKHKQLEQKEKTKVKKKIETKRKKVDVQVNKQKELNRLKDIKKEFEKSITFYKKIGDKKRMNKALKDLDVIIRKIKKLT